MKKIVFLFAAMLVFAAFANGQKTTPNFAGTWNLDTNKSEMGERSRIESMKMTVSQSDTELSYTRDAERSEGGGMGRGGRGMGGGGMGDGEQTSTFDLTGKETTAPGARGSTSKLKASMDGSTMKLTQKREFNSPMGAISIKTVEKWSLSEDGNTLTVQSDTETPRGNRSAKMVFTKAE